VGGNGVNFEHGFLLAGFMLTKKLLRQKKDHLRVVFE